MTKYHQLSSGAHPSSAVFERDDADAISLRVSAAADGLLVLTDSYYPGWRAAVDGAPAPIHRVNYGFRGIPVPRGDHTVDLRYEPDSYRVGLFVTLLAAAALAGAGVALLLSSRESALATASRP